MLQKIHHCAIPKKNIITCLNDWRPVALTPIFSKCFEKLVREHICSVLPASLDPLQFAYRSNRSTDDAIAFTLHTALSHLENKNTYVRMLFVDYSSAFNTIVPATLVAKLQTEGLNRCLCSWILDFLTGRSQNVVRMGNNTSSPLILNTGAPQGCVLSPLLYSLYTHDCTATQLQRHRQIYWRHNGDRPYHWQRWDGLQRGGTLTQFNWTTRTHCTNTTYLLSLDTMQRTSMTLHIRLMYNLLHIHILLCVHNVECVHKVYNVYW